MVRRALNEIVAVVAPEVGELPTEVDADLVVE
jgi:hypothetical protein